MSGWPGRRGGWWLVAAGIVVMAGCGGGPGGRAGRWEGTVDTAAAGHVVVHNAGAGIWEEGEAWRVTEELRLGSLDAEGPETFGQIRSFAVDRAGRIWVLESQAKEIRVFDATGAHVRTIGREGGGPGEFARPMKIDLAPDGNMWAMDPSNGRVSIFDSAGTYRAGKSATGGFIMFPWQGGFDDEGRYYAPVLLTEGGFRFALVRADTSMAALDTLDLPTDPVDRESFRMESQDGRSVAAAGIPFQGGLTYRLAPDGSFWGLFTDEYRLFHIDAPGDTLQVITRAFDPPPVTPKDRQEAIEELKWFTDMGGRIDPSKIPATKPPTDALFLDDEGNIWVATVPGEGEPGARWEVFGPDGRLLGPVELPFVLESDPEPVVRDGLLYGVTRDELDVPYLVRARVARPEE